MHRFTRPLAALAATLVAAAAAAQRADCMTVKEYGQQSNGQDMAAYGKVLTLSFRFLSPELGAVEIGGGDAYATWGLMLGALPAEHVLPWGDTLLAAQPVAFGRGAFDAAGKATVPLDLGGLGPSALEPQPPLRLFMQAMALDANGRPLTSHGLAFELCGAHDGRGTGDTDENDHSISDERYSSHFWFAQLASGKLGVEGWRASFSITLPTAAWQLVYDRTIRENGVTRILLSVIEPPAPGKGGPITRREEIDLGEDDPGHVRIHVADRVQGAPAVYKLAADLR